MYVKLQAKLTAKESRGIFHSKRGYMVEDTFYY